MSKQKKRGNRINKLYVRFITPTSLITATEVFKNIEDLIQVEVVDFKTGKKISKLPLRDFKIKYGETVEP